MSNVHIQTVEDLNGDLVDLIYYHHGCAPDDVPGWPAPGSVDYIVHCEECGERIEEVPLTEEGRRELFDDTHVEIPAGPGWVVFAMGQTEARFDGDSTATIESYHEGDTVATIALGYADSDDPYKAIVHTVGLELTADDCRTLIETLERILEMEQRLS